MYPVLPKKKKMPVVYPVFAIGDNVTVIDGG
jgi:hypothetical protein